MKGCTYVIVLFCLAFNRAAWAQSAPRYPNELAQYPFYASDPWRQIIPLVSTVADVRKILGDPAEAEENYGHPYPGDAMAKRPLFIYQPDKHWKVLIYFVDTYLEEGKYPPALRDRVLSVDFISVDPLPFSQIKLASAFKKNATRGADASWNEFADGTGLTYGIYTSWTPFGNTKPGDLERVSYGASPAELRRLKVDPERLAP